MTRNFIGRRYGFMALALAACLGFYSSPGLAATEKAKKPSSVKKQGSTKFMPGSQETRKERTDRLKRECKGRVNAGACEGYTH
jgi:hypothetical protein